MNNLSCSKLKIQNAKDLNAQSEGTVRVPEEQNFILVSTIMLEEEGEKVHYPSNLYLLMVEESTKQVQMANGSV